MAFHRGNRSPVEVSVAFLPVAMDDVRVTSIELFFDLVFVFTITQLTSLLVAEPDGAGVAKVVLIFGTTPSPRRCC